MEQYVLTAVCFGAWGGTVALVSWLLRGSPNAFIIGAVLGLLSAAAAGGAYYSYLAGCRACP